MLEHYDQAGIVRTVKGETSDIIYPQLQRLVLEEFSK